MKVIFAEGCFDALVEDGMTQEEIDEFKNMILEKFAKEGPPPEGLRDLTKEEVEKIQATIEKNKRKRH